MIFYIVVGLLIIGNFYLWLDGRLSVTLWTTGFLCGMFFAKILTDIGY